MAVISLKNFDVIPVRFNLWIMIFTSCWVIYMLRVNMSLNLIAMVPHPAKNTSSKSQCGPSKRLLNETFKHVDIADVREVPREVLGGTFDWSANQQATILGAYFWCYPITSLVGGMAAERWGPRYVVLITSLASGFLTAISPFAARVDYAFLVIVRFFLGVAGGFVYPALHVLVARWAPPEEKGKFISALMGGTLGTVVTWSLTGPLLERYGWASAFYVPAALTFIWAGFWWYLVADTPADHPRITVTEKKYITDALGDKIKKTKSLPPFKHICTSFPFLAMIVLHFGNLWGLYFIMTVGPKFVSSVLGFELSAAGIISALPYLARLFLATIFGAIGDCILSKKLMTTTVIRKSFCIVSHIIPGILLVLLVYTGCSTKLSVTMITLSMGFNGAATLTNLQNHQDLAPNYAGTLYGIANFVGSTAGFFTPMITAYFTKSGNSFEQWRPVFFVGASVYIVSAIFFILFGSGQTQDWNYIDMDKKNGNEERGRSGHLNDMNDASKENNVKDVKENPTSVTTRT